MPEVWERARNAGLPCEDTSPQKDGSTLRVLIPRIGGDPRPVSIDPRNAQLFLDADFEHWSFVGEHFAIHNAKLSETELVLEIPNYPAMRRLISLTGRREYAGGVLLDQFTAEMVVEYRPRPDSPLRVRIGMTTPALDLAAIPHPRGTRSYSSASLFISGLKTQSTEPQAAISALRQVVDAILFELSTVNKISVDIAPFPRWVRIVAQNHDVGPQPAVPHRKYAMEAVSLFRYAEQAEKLPLLRFLAFYQVIEHFFPHYTERETIRRLRQIIIEPKFDTDSDRDLARLSQTIRSKNFLTEREQLKSTIEYCTTSDDLRAFIQEDPDRASFVASKRGGLKSVPQINPRDTNSSFEAEVTNRIYEIRCRIVHAKDGGGPTQAPLLLPFGAESRMLSHDIQIVRFIAQKVLVASSKQASWQGV